MAALQGASDWLSALHGVSCCMTALQDATYLTATLQDASDWLIALHDVSIISIIWFN
jgi:hypothetical protein